MEGADHDRGPVGFRLLLALWVAGTLRPHEAARLTGMSRAAVSDLTATLVGKGLLSRKAFPDDGRSVTLHLTEAGLERIRTAFREQDERESRWADGLTDEEQRERIARRAW